MQGSVSFGNRPFVVSVESNLDTNTRPSVVPWHAIPDKAVCRKLEVAPDTGLLQTEVAVRLQRHGPNRLAEKPPRPAWLKFLDRKRSTNPILT